MNLTEAAQTIAPYAAGIIASASAWFLGQQKQRGELSQRQSLLTVSEREWLRAETDKRVAELRAERDYLRERCFQLQERLELKEAQMRTVENLSDEAVRQLSEQVGRLQAERIESDKKVADLLKEIDRLNYIIGNSDL